METWKMIDGFEAYEVSDLGRVRRRLPGAPCGHRGRKKRRRKHGSKAWKKGSPGRPPLKVKSQVETQE